VNLTNGVVAISLVRVRYISLQQIIKTSSFVIDRRSYATAKIGLVLRRTGPPFVIGIILCLVMISCFDDETSRTFAYCTAGFVCLFELCVIQIIVTRIYGSKFRQMVDATRTVELSDSTVHVIAEGFGESNVSWAMFTGIATFGCWTFLMQDHTPAVAIPDSAFSSEGELQAFRELVRRKRSEFKRKK